MSILHEFLDPNNPNAQKKPSLRRLPPTSEQHRAARPIDAFAALRRNAEAFDLYVREQARESRPRTIRPVRTGFAVSARRAA